MGDVDGNGVTDLLASDINLLSVRLGNGDGTFTSLPSLGFPAFHLRSLSLTLGRLDADSTLDLVTGSEFTQCAGVHFGRGDGTFQLELGYGSNGLPIDVALGDLDENGVPDIVVANRASTTVTVLLDTSPKTVAVRPPVVGPQRLAFSRVWPRPASGGLLHASFTLPARGRALRELLDPSGRRLARYDLGIREPGPHAAEVGVPPDIRPGIYWLRLLHEGGSAATWVAIVQ
ncbi:MAG: hypothetical protein A2W00_05465 [Candidatus Eisenbacteria bacterium RBG_16_71_46]|nr:MAG: hypothetical protein A2W00_05465 [Candidatus Eisenbacteria bacterium RBG_16_71_46]